MVSTKANENTLVRILWGGRTWPPLSMRQPLGAPVRGGAKQYGESHPAKNAATISRSLESARVSHSQTVSTR